MIGIRAMVLGISTLSTLLWTEPAHAGPVLWSSGAGGNDHYYEFVLVSNPFSGTNNSWATARSAAEARTFAGRSGHLATVTSQGENDFILSLTGNTYSQFTGAWLGGKSPEGWLTGPEAGQAFTYTNWGGVEPNNAGQVYLNLSTVTISGVGPGKWADDSGPSGVGNGDGLPDSVADLVHGYVVEYEGRAAVPEPASWIVLGSGLVGLALLQRRRTRQGHPPGPRQRVA